MSAKRILVVEDEGLTASLVANMLEKQGYVVKAISNPEKAVDTALDFSPDLIMSDVDMPGISGFELAQRFHRHLALKEIPLVLLTSMVTREVLFTARKLGVREVFSKHGLDADALMERVARLMVPVESDLEVEMDPAGGVDEPDDK